MSWKIYKSFSNRELQYYQENFIPELRLGKYIIGLGCSLFGTLILILGITILSVSLEGEGGSASYTIQSISEVVILLIQMIIVICTMSFGLEIASIVLNYMRYKKWLKEIGKDGKTIQKSVRK